MGFLDAELSVTLVNDRTMAALSGRFGRATRPTDVLAFSLLEGEGSEHRAECLGDVVISHETAARQARARRVELDVELRDLLVHGVLHVVGMDHRTEPQTRRMRELEEHLRWEISRVA